LCNIFFFSEGNLDEIWVHSAFIYNDVGQPIFRPYHAVFCFFCNFCFLHCLKLKAYSNVRSQLSCQGCHFTAFLSQRSCHDCSVMSGVVSRLACYSWHGMTFLSWLTCPACLSLLSFNSSGLYFGPKTIFIPPAPILEMIIFPPLAICRFLTPVVAFLP
jgi:hypothetical protein